ncbi:MAG: hypothetical protein DRG78_02870 [Epsilonproteobacteria bacterium]|nr:MAG: hypothetical protein DRG78_02870 [Campylobacterota bacterium]
MENLTNEPEGEDLYSGKTTPRKKPTTMRGKLEYLQELLVDEYIKMLEDKQLRAENFAPVITLLNQNKVVSTPSEGENQHTKVKRTLKKIEDRKQ